MHPKWISAKNKEYEAWVKTLPCIVCNQEGVDPHHVWHARRNDYLCIPLCRPHHTEYHSIEWKKFEEKHNIDLSWEIIKLLIKYQENK